MYHRYTSRGNGPMNANGNRLKDRIRMAVTLVLLLAVILLSIFGGQAMAFKADTHTTFVRRMQTECNQALSLTASLSRTAGANTAATLGRIRSCIYAMDTLNQIHVGLDSAEGYIVSNDVFTNLYAVMDDYSDKIITGMVTGDQQTALTSILTNLQQQVNGLH